MRVPEVRNKGEDFGWDPVNWAESVFQGPDQAEDLDSVLLENIELKESKRRVSEHPYVDFFGRHNLSHVHGARDTEKTMLSHPTRCILPTQTYLASKATACRIPLLACRC